MSLHFNGIQITRAVFKLLVTGIRIMGALALSQEIHRPHLAGCSPVIRVLSYSHNLKYAGMFQVVTEVLSNGMAILEILFLKEAIHQGHGARRGRVLLIDSPAFNNLGADRVGNSVGSRAAMMRHDQVFRALAAGRLQYIRPLPSYHPPLGCKAKS